MFHCFQRVTFEAAGHCSDVNLNRLSFRHWDEGKGSELYAVIAKVRRGEHHLP